MPDVKPTEDWQLLADTWDDLGDPNLLTLERSPEYFRWLYGSKQSDCELPYVVRAGNALGWFSLSRSVRGQRGRIRSVALADWCLPRSVSLARVLATAREITAPQADVIVVPGRCRPTLSAPMPGIRRRRPPSPSAFVISKTHRATTIAGSLQLALADGF